MDRTICTVAPPISCGFRVLVAAAIAGVIGCKRKRLEAQRVSIKLDNVEQNSPKSEDPFLEDHETKPTNTEIGLKIGSHFIWDRNT